MSPSSNEMKNKWTPETLDVLKTTGSYIFLLNSPNELNIGIDYCMWKTGPKFMGIKLIPPGPHFIYWSLSEHNDKVYDEFRFGVFVYLQPGQVHVRKWNELDETFESVSSDDEEQYTKAVKNFEFDENLGPYPIEWCARWHELSYYISQDVINRIEPVNKYIGSSVKEYNEDPRTKRVRIGEVKVIEMGESTESPRAQEMQEFDQARKNKEDSDRSPKNEANGNSAKSSVVQSPEALGDLEQVKKGRVLETNDGEAVTCIKFGWIGRHISISGTILETKYFQSDTLFFCDVPKAKIAPGSTPADVTRLSHDRSNILESILQTQLGNDTNQLLGELQFSYICFLLGQNYEAFEHWKELIILLCHCEAIVVSNPQLYYDFLRVLHSHLTQAPDDFFSDVLLAGNFLTRCLANLCEVCSDPSLPNHLQKRVKYIEDAILKKFHMSVYDLCALGEDAPVIVDEDDSFLRFESDNNGSDMVDIVDGTTDKSVTDGSKHQ